MLSGFMGMFVDMPQFQSKRLMCTAMVLQIWKFENQYMANIRRGHSNLSRYEMMSESQLDTNITV